jgi:hypothetical protein
LGALRVLPTPYLTLPEGFWITLVFSEVRLI